MPEYRTKYNLSDGQEKVLKAIKDGKVRLYWYANRWWAAVGGVTLQMSSIRILEEQGYVRFVVEEFSKAYLTCTEAGRNYAPRVRTQKISERYYSNLGRGGKSGLPVLRRTGT